MKILINLTNNKSLYICYHTSDKIESYFSISVSSIENKFCDKMLEISKHFESEKIPVKHVCAKCYSRKLETIYKNTYNSLLTNEWMKHETLNSKDLQIIKDFFENHPILKNIKEGRFDSYGEIENAIQLETYFKLCNLLNDKVFSIWTKNKKCFIDLCASAGKPQNLIAIYSNMFVDNIIHNPPLYFDKVFNVVTLDFVIQNESVKYNCSAKCNTCKKCYTQGNKETCIIEILRDSGYNALNNKLKKENKSLYDYIQLKRHETKSLSRNSMLYACENFDNSIDKVLIEINYNDDIKRVDVLINATKINFRYNHEYAIKINKNSVSSISGRHLNNLLCDKTFNLYARKLIEKVTGKQYYNARLLDTAHKGGKK